MTPPFILSENGNIEIYETPEMLALDVELIDVKNEEYEVFDSNGNKLQFLVPESKSSTGFFGRFFSVKQEVIELRLLDELSDEGRLRKLLTDYLEVQKVVLSLDRPDLAELISEVKRFQSS